MSYLLAFLLCGFLGVRLRFFPAGRSHPPPTVIGDIKTTPLKENGYGMEDTARLALALRADTYWFIIKPLSSIKTVMAEVTFVFVGRHWICSTRDSSISSKLKQASVLAHLEFHAGHRYNVIAGKSGVWRSPV